MTTFVTRAQWGARPRKSGTTEIIDHPSVTGHWVGGGWEFPWDHSSCDDKVRGIQVDHMDNREWSDIAYNYLVCPHDYVFEGRGYDRRSSANGSDSANSLSFAICALWGSNSADDPLPNGLKNAFLYARAILRSKGGATSIVKGHRDWKETDCPGPQIYAWIQAGCPDPDVSKDIEMATVSELRALIREELEFSALTDGQPLHELVQMYSAFNAENTRQNVDQAEREVNEVDTEVDLVLKDDFQNLANKLNSVVENQNQMASTLTQLVNKLNNPTP